MTDRETVVRAVRFEHPAIIPMSFHINAACWHHYDQDALQDLMAAHPLLFPNFERQARVTPHYGLNQRADAPYTDPWGCVWETTDDGITGTVRHHPLADWDRFDGYTPPDPAETDGTFPVDWARIRDRVMRRRRAGEMVVGGLPHGHTFLRLQDIRGYENLILDMHDGEPRLQMLIEQVADFNERVVRRWLALDPDMMAYGEDLGMQVGPMLSPAHFRRYIQPVYRRLMAPARAQGVLVHMHSDGDIRTLAEDLIDGVDVINLQDRVNGIDWIAETLKGRTCVELDVDRQHVTAHGTPDQIDALIRTEVATLGSPAGGLMMIYGLYPGVPLANVAALMDAMARYATYYA
jgi:uroporphyrinogen decarboxylase